jgi:hypothetical protein
MPQLGSNELDQEANLLNWSLWDVPGNQALPAPGIPVNLTAPAPPLPSNTSASASASIEPERRSCPARRQR